MYLVEYQLQDKTYSLDSKEFDSKRAANDYIQRQRHKYPLIRRWRIVEPREEQRSGTD